MNQPKAGSILIAKSDRINLCGLAIKIEIGKEYKIHEIKGDSIIIWIQGNLLYLSLIDGDIFYWGNFFELKSEPKETDYKSIVKEIDNLMERWHLARDNNDETLERINDILYTNGMLTFFNDKNKIENGK